MKFALHKSYLTALMHILSQNDGLDCVFEVTDVNDSAATQTLINDALASVSKGANEAGMISHDVSVTGGGEAQLGYIRAYFPEDGDGTVEWAHSLC